MVTHFRGWGLPEPGDPVGYAWLMETYALVVPLPHRLTAIAARHHPISTKHWSMLLPRQRPEESLAGHLRLALRHEGINLAVLERLTHVVPDAEVAAIVVEQPTSVPMRRLWFIWEWLTGRKLDLPDAGKVTYAPILDPELYVGLTEGTPSARHKIIHNLPGTPAFCPLVRRTAALDASLGADLAAKARAVIGRTRPDLMQRAAAFMLLDDSKASFAIEGERPSAERSVRWGQAIGESGRQPISIPELERLQRIVIGDTRFVRLGLRKEGGFVGSHDRETAAPIPSHLSARHEDLEDLLRGLVQYEARALMGGLDPIVMAAILAFGFVYIHPFEDGNGRIHRYLVHHALARGGFNPEGVIFPVSVAILRNVAAYNTVLRSVSEPLLPLIPWRATSQGNVEIMADTAHHYRFFDATPHAEFLAACVQETIEIDLPREVSFLTAFERFTAGVARIVDMPDRMIELLRGFLAQSGGRFSKRARSKEFAALTDAEVEEIESLWTDCFADEGNGAPVPP
jgi:hypothetical protein